MNKRDSSQFGIIQEKQVQVSAHIDWVSTTVPHAAMRHVHHGVVLLDDFTEPYTVTRATMGYAQARRYKSGAIVQWHDNHPNMGVHVTYSAQALQYAAENFKMSQSEILNHLTEFSRVSRLDVCVDVDNVEIDIRQLHLDMRSGKVKTRAKTFDYVESAKAGNELGARTAYVGSMHKRKKLLRVYDKGLQLNLDHFKTRFELEVHGMPAQHAAMILKSSPELMAQQINGMITGYADFSETHAGKYLSSNNPIKLAHPMYKKSDTAKWLIDVVAKTLARETFQDYNVLEDFMKAFQYHYQQLETTEIYTEINNDEK